MRASVQWVLFGLAMQVQLALGILGEQPSVRELETTGLDFGANALLPWLWDRGHAISDGLASVPASAMAGVLVGLALAIAYLPAGVLIMLRTRARALSLGSSLAIVLVSSACAGLVPQPSSADLPATAAVVVSGDPTPQSQPPPVCLIQVQISNP